MVAHASQWLCRFFPRRKRDLGKATLFVWGQFPGRNSSVSYEQPPVLAAGNRGFLKGSHEWVSTYYAIEEGWVA